MTLALVLGAAAWAIIAAALLHELWRGKEWDGSLYVMAAFWLPIMAVSLVRDLIEWIWRTGRCAP